MGGYVYIVKCVDKYKIGWSSNVTNRVLSLNKTSPYPVELIHAFYADKPKRTEQRIHYEYRGKKCHDEWFNLDEKDICYLRKNS